MKIIKISFLLLILSTSISCEKDDEPTITLAQNLQNDFWLDDDEDQVLKFDGSNFTSYFICTDDNSEAWVCNPILPLCISLSAQLVLGSC